MAKDANTILQKWADKTANSAEDYRKGVQQTDVNPMERAAEQVQFYKSQVQAAVDSGHMAQRLRDTPKQKWVDGAAGKGANNIAAGVTRGKPAMQRFLAVATPITQASKAQIRSMPKGGDANALARFKANMDNMKSIKAAYRR